eukprot:4917635-Amphidinium_carterae.1
MMSQWNRTMRLYREMRKKLQLLLNSGGYTGAAIPQADESYHGNNPMIVIMPTHVGHTHRTTAKASQPAGKTRSVVEVLRPMR